MAYEESLRSISLDADASIGIYTGVPGQPGSPNPHGGKQYHFVKLTGNHQVGLAVGVADAVVGVLQNKPQTPGSAATVAYSGVTNVIAGAAITAGTAVGPDAAGAAVGAGANAVAGYAITASTAAGQLIPVLLK